MSKGFGEYFMAGGDDLRDSKMLSHALFNPPNLYANGLEHRKHTHWPANTNANARHVIFEHNFYLISELSFGGTNCK